MRYLQKLDERTSKVFWGPIPRSLYCRSNAELMCFILCNLPSRSMGNAQTFAYSSLKFSSLGWGPF